MSNQDLSQVEYVMVNGKKYKLNGTPSSLDQVKAVAAKRDAGIANAEPYIEGNTVSFRYRAGTKGC